jgi:hypothetical protein
MGEEIRNGSEKWYLSVLARKRNCRSGEAVSANFGLWLKRELGRDRTASEVPGQRVVMLALFSWA